mmetsp:Transcript_44330/g.125539  ORF Transcript_44330/g.125539 Transcript_44330/m.125539 type:complete len:377 (-) Transcript_44330:25-1155(-)
MEEVEGWASQVTALVPPQAAHLPPSKVLGGLVLGLSLWRSVMPSLDEALALVPHHTVYSPILYFPVPFCWNLATAHFFEASLLKAVIVTPLLVVLSRMLERLWAVRALALHLIFTAVSSGLVVFAVQVICVYRTHQMRLFFLPVRGSIGLLVALTVGLRHAYPLEALPLLPRAWGLQCQHAPFGLALILTLVGLAAPRWVLPEWLFAPLALFFGWLNLRYLMWFPYAEAHGDHSPDFCFAALFPRPLRPFVACIGTTLYGIGCLVAPGFVRLRQVDGDMGQSIVYDPSTAVGPSGAGDGGAPRPPGPAIPAPVPGGPGSKEYNARRAKALQLLDDNINSLLAPGAGRPVTFSRKMADEEAVDVDPIIPRTKIDTTE